MEFSKLELFTVQMGKIVRKRKKRGERGKEGRRTGRGSERESASVGQ